MSFYVFGQLNDVPLGYLLHLIGDTLTPSDSIGVYRDQVHLTQDAALLTGGSAAVVDANGIAHWAISVVAGIDGDHYLHFPQSSNLVADRIAGPWAMVFAEVEEFPSYVTVGGLIGIPGDTEALLVWDTAEQMDTVGSFVYDVYRSVTSPSSGFSLIASNVTATTYLDTGRTNGTTYYYKVRAFVSMGTFRIGDSELGGLRNDSNVVAVVVGPAVEMWGSIAQ